MHHYVAKLTLPDGETATLFLDGSWGATDEDLANVLNTDFSTKVIRKTPSAGVTGLENQAFAAAEHFGAEVTWPPRLASESQETTVVH